MKNYTLHIPEGVRDFLSNEASMKQYIEEKIKKVFMTYSYEAVETPTFEYLDIFTLGDSSFQKGDLYKWVNREGEVVALRSDQTRAIARVVATWKEEIIVPKRYAYISPTFRYLAPYQGKMHEFTQAGVELIGDQSAKSDVEVILVAIEAIRGLGIEDFTIHIGSAPFLSKMLSSIGLTEQVKAQIYEAIETKDAVSIRTILEEVKEAQEVIEVLLYMMQRSGKIELLQTIKEKISNPSIQQELVKLENLYNQLNDLGVAQYILFDFSVLSYASYYTGMMFQGYTSGVGAAIVEGGRYDTLLQKFGVDLPAVGMAININLLLQKYQELFKQTHEVVKTLFVWDDTMAPMMNKVAQNFRAQGLIVEYALGHVLEQQLQYAISAGIQGMMYFKANGVVEIIDVVEQTKQEVSLEALLEA